MVVSDVVTCLVPEYAKTRNAVPALVRDRGKRLHLDILDCILHGTATNELVKEFLETLPGEWTHTPLYEDCFIPTRA